MSRVLGVFVLVLLSACASSVSNRELDSQKPQLPGIGKDVHIFYTANRMLELEPCGCMFWPIGGIVREFNAMKFQQDKISGPSIHLNSGTTFLPSSETRLSRSQRMSKSRILVRAMNLLGVQVHTPSLEDVKQDLKDLEALKGLSKFEWVASNLQSKKGSPVFKRSYLLQTGDAKVLILGALAKGSGPGWISTDPIAAIKELVPKVAQGVDLVVVLSAVAPKERDQLAEIPGVHVVLGADTDEQRSDASQHTKHSIVANPYDRGRALAYLGVRIPAAFSGFYSPSMASNLNMTRELWTRWKREAEEDLRDASTSSQKREAREKMARFDGFLKRTVDVPMSPSAGTAFFDSQDFKLSTDFDGSNALSALLSEYKELSRKAAIDNLE